MRARPVRAYNVSEVLLTPYAHRPCVLSLTKVKYDCTNYNANFTESGTMISLVVKTTIFLDLSQDEYERRCTCYFVSPTFCWKILNRIPLKKVIRRLPEVLCFDEYKTTQNSDNGLAFVYPDVIAYELFDILDSRKQ